MKKQAKKPARKSTKHKWPETMEHHRFGTLRLFKDQYSTQIEWGGCTIVFMVLGLNNELTDEDSVHHILDAASILLINEPGWRQRFEALIKRGIDAGSLDHWQLKPRQKSQLCKNFEPSIISVAWSADYELQLYVDLRVTDPIVAKAPSASFWTIELTWKRFASRLIWRLVTKSAQVASAQARGSTSVSNKSRRVA